MERMKDSDARFKSLELKTGLLVFFALVGILAVVVSVGLERDIFSKKFTLHFYTDSGAGFKEAMPVKISGFKIGRIKGIELSETAKVKITLEIGKKYQKWLRRGSIAKVGKEGFIGEASVDVTPGSPDGQMLVDKDVIPYEKARGVEELVEEVKPVLREVKDIIHYVNDPEGDLKQTLGNVKDVTAGLQSTKARVDGVLDETNAAIKKVQGLVDNVEAKAKPAVDSATKAVKNLEGATQKVEKIMNDAEAVTKKLPATTEKIDRVIDNVKTMSDAFVKDTPRIRELLSDVGDAAKDGKALVKGIKEGFPGRLVLPAQKPPELVPLDGALPEK